MSDIASEKPVKRSWTRFFRFQFSVRTMLLAMLVAGPATFAWYKFLEPYRRDMEVVNRVLDLKGGYVLETQAPAWAISLFGEKHFQRVVAISLKGNQLKDEDLRFLGQATNLRSLTIMRCNRLSEDAARPLKKLPQLTEQTLMFPISRKTLPTIGKMKKLRVLVLYRANVNGDELAPLADLKELEKVTLVGRNLHLNDYGFEHLSELPKLNEVILRTITLRGAGVKRFQKERRQR